MIILYEGDKISVSGAWKVLSSFGFAEKQIRQLPNVIPKSDKYLTRGFRESPLQMWLALMVLMMIVCFQYLKSNYAPIIRG